MERCSPDHFEQSALRFEHNHRYQLAALFATGTVVDCACGIGYGSRILIAGNSAQYFGFDPSVDSIAFAQENYASDRSRFDIAKLESLPLRDAQADLVVSLETLEHVDEPRLAVTEIRRILKHDGLFVGSVPSEYYEQLCEQVYSPNPFHIQRFSAKRLNELLLEYFEDAEIYAAEFMVGTLLSKSSNNDTSRAPATALALQEKPAAGVAGSYFFIAGTTQSVSAARIKLGAVPLFLSGLPKVEIDREEKNPLLSTIKKMDSMIEDRDQAILAQTQLIEERAAIMNKLERMISDRDTAIYAQTIAVNERDALISRMEQTITERLHYTASLELNTQQQAERIAALDATIDNQNKKLNSVKFLTKQLFTRLLNFFSAD